jgi:hypothetical protein
MNTIFKAITSGIIVTGFSIVANADYIQLADRSFTLMLTAKYSAPGLTVKDPDTGETYSSFEDSYSIEDANYNLTKEVEKFAAVAKTYKFGNKEIVQFAYEEGLLDDDTTSGWALIVRDGEQPSIQLKKRIGGEDTYVDVGIYLGEDSSIGEIAGKYDNVTSYAYQYDSEMDYYEEISATNTVSGSYTEEGKISLELDGFSVSGAYSGSAKTMSFYPKYEDYNGKLVEDKSEAIYEFIPGAAKISNLVGTSESEDEGFMIITGSGSIGAGKGTIVRE